MLCCLSIPHFCPCLHFNVMLFYCVYGSTLFEIHWCLCFVYRTHSSVVLFKHTTLLSLSALQCYAFLLCLREHLIRDSLLHNLTYILSEMWANIFVHSLFFSFSYEWAFHYIKCIFLHFSLLLNVEGSFLTENVMLDLTQVCLLLAFSCSAPPPLFFCAAQDSIIGFYFLWSRCAFAMLDLRK